MLTPTWWVLHHTGNPQKNPFEVFSVPPGKEEPKDGTLLWSGQASSREEAWELAIKRHSWLKVIPIPASFKSGSILERTDRNSRRAAKARRMRAKPQKEPPLQVQSTHTGETHSKAEKIFNLIAASEKGLFSSEVVELSGVAKNSATSRLNEFVKSKCVIRSIHQGNSIYQVAPGATFQEYRNWYKQRDGSRDKNKTSRIREALKSFLVSCGDDGATCDEAKEYLLEQHEDFDEGSIESRFFEMRTYLHIVPHPDGLTRGKKKPVYIAETPMACLLRWKLLHKDQRDNPKFAEVFAAIDNLK